MYQRSSQLRALESSIVSAPNLETTLCAHSFVFCWNAIQFRMCTLAVSFLNAITSRVLRVVGDDAIEPGMCKQIMWPMFHYVLPMSPSSAARFEPSLWQVQCLSNSQVGSCWTIAHFMLVQSLAAYAGVTASHFFRNWVSLYQNWRGKTASPFGFKWCFAGVHSRKQKVCRSCGGAAGTWGRLCLGTRLPPVASAHTAAQTLSHGGFGRFCGGNFLVNCRSNVQIRITKIPSWNSFQEQPQLSFVLSCSPLQLCIAQVLLDRGQNFIPKQNY